MKLFEGLLRRLGYVKLQRYGLMLSPAGSVVPQPGVAIPGWNARQGEPLPLPGSVAPMQDVGSVPQPAAAYAPTLPAPAPVVEVPRAPQSASVPRAASSRKTMGEESQEWEWRRVTARAKARGDVTAIIPKGNQAAQVAAAAAVPSRPLPPLTHSGAPPRLPGTPAMSQSRPALVAPGRRGPAPAQRPVAMVTPPTMRRPAPVAAPLRRPASGRPQPPPLPPRGRPRATPSATVDWMGEDTAVEN